VTAKHSLPIPKRDLDGSIWVQWPNGDIEYLHPLHAAHYAQEWQSVVGGAYVSLMTRPKPVPTPPETP
jgi:hypothetical protein